MKYIPPCHVKLPQHSSLIRLTFIHSGEERENANQVYKKCIFFHPLWGREPKGEASELFGAKLFFFLHHKGSLTFVLSIQ